VKPPVWYFRDQQTRTSASHKFVGTLVVGRRPRLPHFNLIGKALWDYALLCVVATGLANLHLWDSCDPSLLSYIFLCIKSQFCFYRIKTWHNNEKSTRITGIL